MQDYVTEFQTVPRIAKQATVKRNKSDVENN